VNEHRLAVIDLKSLVMLIMMLLLVCNRWHFMNRKACNFILQSTWWKCNICEF